MKGIIEYKDNVGSVKDVDLVSRTMSGYLSIFGNTDHDKDITEPGAFKKSITERGPITGTNEIFFLNYHKWDQPHNKFRALQEDSEGLYFEATLKDVSYSNDTLTLYNEGVLSQFSYGFIPVKKEMKNGIRHLKENFLLEGSNVTLGANSRTRFTGFKCKTIEEAEDTVKKVMNVLRNGSLTDETFMQLEIALKQLQKDAYDMGINSVKENQPEITTEEPLNPNKEQLTKGLTDLFSEVKWTRN